MRQLFCFSIDNKGTRAVDDVVSIETIQLKDGNQFWRLGIHIADLSPMVTQNSAMDKCAKERVNSKYIGKVFFKSMLPREIYSNIGSLKSIG